MTSRTRSLAAIAVVLLMASLLPAGAGTRALDSNEGMGTDAPRAQLPGDEGARPAFQSPAEPPSVSPVANPSPAMPVSAAGAGSPAVGRPVGPFGGTADYDSGWVDMDAGDAYVFTHNLGGDPDDYVVDLSTVTGGFITQAPFSQEGFGGDIYWDGQEMVESGYIWNSLDATQIEVVKGADEESAGPLRLRIWRLPGADYDSGWRDLSRTQILTLQHELGGDPDDYSVYLEFLDEDEGFGVNRAGYGLDTYHWGGKDYFEVGAAWVDLTSASISIDRGRQDTYADQARVRIWRVPGADYDSGWVDVAQDELLTLAHDLGGPWNDFYVDVQFWRDEWHGRHQAQYGLDSAKPYADVRVYGASLRYLFDGTLSIYRGSYDILVHRVRVRIWADPKPKYDSGWVSIDQDEWLTLEHRLGGDPDYYHIDLQFKDTDADGDCCHGINQWAYGGDFWVDPDDNQQAIGAYWNQLTSDSIVVRRFPGDHKADEIRLRIWSAPAPDYRFAGNWAGAGPGGVYDHFVGGEPDDYVVSVLAQHGDWLGLNVLGFGRDRTAPDQMQGFHWADLTDESAEVTFGGDSDMDHPSVSIWQNPNPAYDSGWRSLTPAAVRAFGHGLGFHPNLYRRRPPVPGRAGGPGREPGGLWAGHVLRSR